MVGVQHVYCGVALRCGGLLLCWVAKMPEEREREREKEREDKASFIISLP